SDMDGGSSKQEPGSPAKIAFHGNETDQSMPEEDCPTCNPNGPPGEPVRGNVDVIAYAAPMPPDGQLAPWPVNEGARVAALKGFPDRAEPPSQLMGPSRPTMTITRAQTSPAVGEGIIHDTILDATPPSEMAYLPPLGAPWFEPATSLVLQDIGQEGEEPPPAEDPCDFARLRVLRGRPPSTVRINLNEDRNADGSWAFDRSFDAEGIANQFGGEDAWGHAQVDIRYEIDVQRWYERGCCCVWLQSIEINVDIRLYVASDVPEDELARTEWHEAEHARMSRILLGSLNALARQVTGQFGRHAPTCGMQPSLQQCERIRRQLAARWDARVARAIAEYERLNDEAAEWFHDNEGRLWQLEQPED